MFSRILVVAFKEFINKFLEVYFNDWTIFGVIKDHIYSLCIILERCRQYHISLNLQKFIFCAPFGILLGHVVCKEGILMDPTKIVIIFSLPPPTSVKKLRTTLGHIGYYHTLIRGYDKNYYTDGETTKKGCQIPVE